MVHGIVKSMHGTMQVSSEPGKGSQFYVYLPVVKQFFKKQNTLKKEDVLTGTDHILLVDYDEGIKGLLMKPVVMKDLAEKIRK